MKSITPILEKLCTRCIEENSLIEIRRDKGFAILSFRVPYLHTRDLIEIRWFNSKSDFKNFNFEIICEGVSIGIYVGSQSDIDTLSTTNDTIHDAVKKSNILRFSINNNIPMDDL